MGNTLDGARILANSRGGVFRTGGVAEKYKRKKVGSRAEVRPQKIDDLSTLWIRGEKVTEPAGRCEARSGRASSTLGVLHPVCKTERKKKGAP